MKILVCVSKVPDTTTKINFTDNNTQFDSNGVQFIINPMDEYALTRGIELTEAQGGTVTIVNVGGADTEPIIRKGLALGAHDAVRIDADPSDSLMVARNIAAYAAEGAFDLILCGKETIDYNGAQVPAMIAEILNIACVNGVSSLEVADGKATMQREIDGGKEKIESALPLVLSGQEGIAEPRIPNMRGIMGARTKPLEVKAATDTSSSASYANYELPPAKSEVKLVDPDNVDELVRLLNEEAKAL